MFSVYVDNYRRLERAKQRKFYFVELFLFGYDLLFEYSCYFDNNWFINYLFNFKHVSMYVYNMSCIYLFIFLEKILYFIILLINIAFFRKYVLWKYGFI